VTECAAPAATYAMVKLEEGERVAAPHVSLIIRPDDHRSAIPSSETGGCALSWHQSQRD